VESTLTLLAGFCLGYILVVCAEWILFLVPPLLATACSAAYKGAKE
jgi:hypothetical protein